MLSGLWDKMRERRAASRLETRLDARVRVVEATSRGALVPFAPARLINLSQNGCQLALPSLVLGNMHLHRCLNSGQDYLLEIEIASPQGGTWIMLAEAVWANQNPRQQDHPFSLGVRFTGAVALPPNWRRILCPSGESQT